MAPFALGADLSLVRTPLLTCAGTGRAGANTAGAATSTAIPKTAWPSTPKWLRFNGGLSHCPVSLQRDGLALAEALFRHYLERMPTKGLGDRTRTRVPVS